jgi:hypothetical protein
VTTPESTSEAGVRSAPMTDSDPDGVRWAVTIVLFCALFAILLFVVPLQK